MTLEELEYKIISRKRRYESDFYNLYAKTVKVLALQLVNENPDFAFFDNPGGLYEEYMNQKALLHWMYGKEDSLLDRHKVCACLTVAIIKVRLLSGNLPSDEKYQLCNANCVNEQLAFLPSWELLEAFVVVKEKKSRLILHCFVLFIMTLSKILFQGHCLWLTS